MVDKKILIMPPLRPMNPIFYQNPGARDKRRWANYQEKWGEAEEKFRQVQREGKLDDYKIMAAGLKEYHELG